jgi:hypothetical protein
MFKISTLALRLSFRTPLVWQIRKVTSILHLAGGVLGSDSCRIQLHLSSPQLVFKISVASTYLISTASLIL